MFSNVKIIDFLVVPPYSFERAAVSEDRIVCNFWIEAQAMRETEVSAFLLWFFSLDLSTLNTVAICSSERRYVVQLYDIIEKTMLFTDAVVRTLHPTFSKGFRRKFRRSELYQRVTCAPDLLFEANK
jgi:hypothetical protein